MKKRIQMILFFFICFAFMQAQEAPEFISQGVFLGKTMPLSEMPTAGIPPVRDNTEARIIRNRLRAPRKVNANALPLFGEPNAQTDFGGITSFALEENFDGATVSEGGALPPDPTGAVGPNHYVHAFNLGIKIFDKTGTLLFGPISLGDFFQNGVNSGDPIVLYDQLADRFFVSQFRTSNNALLIAVSETADPTGAYNLYEFPLNAFPDYPKYSVWPDGYYMTANKFTGNTTYVLERDVILAGGANPQIVGFNLPGIVNNPNSVRSPNPAHLLGTSFTPNTPGQIVYFQDDGWSGVTFDHLKIWEITMDWNTSSNSTISAPLEIPTQPFESTFAPFGTGDVNQPGTGQKIDMIAGVISYMVNYREFTTHNSMTVTFNVDVDGNDRSGIRWIELRTDGVNPWTIFQEGTYAPADNNSRFMGSLAMDAAGNMGMGFQIASGTLPVGIRYTGRFDGDPLGQMTVAETTIIDGIGVQTNSNRFGDYTHLTMDPDNFTFWFTGEYFSSNNFWRTRIASFSLSGGFNNDLGVNTILNPNDGILTANESVQVSVRNFGLNAQTNFPLELRVDGNLVATENFVGTINPNETANYTFAQTVDLSTQGQTYVIAAQTNLAGDEFPGNDSFTKNVTHLLTNDVGVVDILSPTTGEGLGQETIVVRVKNFGANPQSNFNVSYSIDGGTPVVETITNTLNSLEQLDFSFTQTGDFSALGTYVISSSTLLAGDGDSANDTYEVTIQNQQCSPTGNCTLGDGLTRFSIGTIDNATTCSPNGFGDFTSLNTELDIDTQVNVIARSGFANQLLSVWVDYNDNQVFEVSERVIFDFPLPNSGVSYTSSFVIPNDINLLGTHLLRARVGWVTSEGTINDPCVDFTWGETEDYTVTLLDGTLSVAQNDFYDADFLVYPIGTRIYEVLFQPKTDLGEMSVEVYNILGQKITSAKMSVFENGYKTLLNFETVTTGTYLVKVFNGSYSTVKRILVK
ncbi:MAG: hypothetical protein COZ75_09485 [Flavobacteriaceae bacterium CG_4_8_14_3_um_filter_34_10]|nr:T9SS type A sorting domain-containing protein [Flavobacteriia bacterium]PIV48613.1 MAG: hypothetical protein COS19_13050 [Flavobacteriaceae bacterium CG02_land_8_20_14_3_00_34_13]PIX08929.1 MAG: hypothetical protein COZ75_09485 [Flavobacteriaceae bacterium CG_4_8_14_3_um_filter_34_10]PJC07339.1 MAG: hypothetical protein CO068_06775 [Flavobacteriaceae bacterium CG_4_9_14_0_8_um_filter_34_30]